MTSTHEHHLWVSQILYIPKHSASIKNRLDKVEIYLPDLLAIYFSVWDTINAHYLGVSNENLLLYAGLRLYAVRVVAYSGVLAFQRWKRLFISHAHASIACYCQVDWGLPRSLYFHGWTSQIGNLYREEWLKSKFFISTASSDKCESTEPLGSKQRRLLDSIITYPRPY